MPSRKKCLGPKEEMSLVWSRNKKKVKEAGAQEVQDEVEDVNWDHILSALISKFMKLGLT